MKRTWATRLVQLTPVLLLAAILGVWFLVPASARMLTSGAFMDATGMDGYEMRWPGAEVETLQRFYAAENGNTMPDLVEMSGLKRATRYVSGEVNKSPQRVRDAAGVLKPDALEPSDAVFDGIRQHERETGGQVTVLLMDVQTRPRVAMSAIEDITVLTPEERAELEASGTVDALRSAIASATTGGVALIPDAVGSSSSGEDSTRAFFFGLQMSGGRFYETIVVCPKSNADRLSGPETWGWTVLEDDAHRKELSRVARRCGGVALIVGPLDGQPVRLSPPGDADTGTRERLVEGVLAERGRILPSEEPFALPPQLSAASGGARWGSVIVAGQIRSADSTGSSLLVMTIGTYREHPAMPSLWDRVGDTPFRRLQVWLTTHMVTTLTALAVLFVVSLVAVPFAYTSERKRLEQADIQRERERVRAEAAERVIGRLSRLSDNIDRAAAAEDERIARHVDGVSGDIQSTVSELKKILGDAGSAREADDV